jgi:hypothetical protein
MLDIALVLVDHSKHGRRDVVAAVHRGPLLATSFVLRATRGTRGTRGASSSNSSSASASAAASDASDDVGSRMSSSSSA